MMAVVRDYLEKLEHDEDQTLAAQANALRANDIDVRYSTSYHVSPF